MVAFLNRHSFQTYVPCYVKLAAYVCRSAGAAWAQLLLCPGPHVLALHMHVHQVLGSDAHTLLFLHMRLASCSSARQYSSCDAAV